MRDGSAIGSSPAATAGPRSAAGAPAGEQGARRLTPRRREPPRPGHPGNIAGGGKTFSPPPALCSGPTRSRLSSSDPLPPASLSRWPPTGSAGRAARPLRYRRGLHGRRSLAVLPRPPPPPCTIASPGAPHGPERSRGRSWAARAAPHWLPPQERAGAARPHCPPRPRRIPPSLGGGQGAGPRSQPGAGNPPPSRLAAGPHFLRTARPPSGFHLRQLHSSRPAKGAMAASAYLRCVGPGRPSPPRAPHGPRSRCAPRGVPLLVPQPRVAGSCRGGAWAAAAALAGFPLLPPRACSLCRSNNGVRTTLGGAQGEPEWAPRRSAADS